MDEVEEVEVCFYAYSFRSIANVSSDAQQSKAARTASATRKGKASSAHAIAPIRLPPPKLIVSEAGQRKGEEEDEDVSMDEVEVVEVCF
jgi:hypothetical protein